MRVNITPDIRNFKEKIWNNFTTRQLISIGIAGAIAFLLYRTFDMPDFIRRYLVIACVLPVLLIGFCEYQGMYFEEFLLCLFNEFWNPQLRPYKPENDIVEEIKKGHVKEKEDNTNGKRPVRNKKPVKRIH
jgi:uncharacterized sodium:solute symporter family permease YidK